MITPVSAVPSPSRPGEKRDRVLGTIMIGIGIALIALIFAPLIIEVPEQLELVRHMSSVTVFPILWGGYQLRNSYAEDLGEAPQFQTRRARRIGAALLFATGSVGLGAAVILPFLKSVSFGS